MVKLLLLVVLVLAVTSLVLLFRQHGLIYVPRPYDEDFLENVSEWVKPLAFFASEGRQYAYYLGPAGSPQVLPERLWVMFGGNAGLALGWLSFLEGNPYERDGFLLIEYPGYGKNEGRASPGKNYESSESALEALASHLGVKVSAFEGRLSVVGHSLGAAEALEFASHHAARRILLIAPFTSMHDMAVRAVGYPFCYLLLYRYDNIMTLRKLSRTNPKPRVVIFHGSDDGVVPVGMGRELAGIDSAMIEYVEVEGRGHDDILEDAKRYFHTRIE